MSLEPIRLKEARFPAFGICRPNKVAAKLGEGFFNFDRSDGVSGVGRVAGKTAEVIAIKTNMLAPGALDAFVKDLTRVYPIVMFMGVNGGGVYESLRRYGFTRIIRMEDGCMMSGWAWNKGGIAVETGCFVAIPIGDHDALRLTAILSDEINIGDTPENALALCRLQEPINLISIYEVGTIDTTIFLKEYTHGRTSNQETAG